MDRYKSAIINALVKGKEKIRNSLYKCTVIAYTNVADTVTPSHGHGFNCLSGNH